MQNLSLSELYSLRSDLSFELIEANEQEAYEIGKQLEEVENAIILKEVESDG